MGLVPELGKRHDVRLIGYRVPGPVDRTGRGGRHADHRVRATQTAGNARDLALAMLFQRARCGRSASPVACASRCQEELARFQPDLVHVAPGSSSGLKSEIPGPAEGPRRDGHGT